MSRYGIGRLRKIRGLKKLWEKWVFEKWKKIKRKRLEEESKGVLRAALDVKTGAALNGQYLLKQVLAIRIKYLF